MTLSNGEILFTVTYIVQTLYNKNISPPTNPHLVVKGLPPGHECPASWPKCLIEDSTILDLREVYHPCNEYMR